MHRILFVVALMLAGSSVRADEIRDADAKACTHDAMTTCIWSLPHGEQAIADCLLAHHDEISPECRARLDMDRAQPIAAHP